MLIERMHQRKPKKALELQDSSRLMNCRIVQTKSKGLAKANGAEASTATTAAREENWRNSAKRSTSEKR